MRLGRAVRPIFVVGFGFALVCRGGDALAQVYPGLEPGLQEPPAGLVGPGGVPIQPPAGEEQREWTITPSLGVEETFTNNVRQVASPKQEDLVTSIEPALNVIGNTPRIQLVLSYTPQFQENVNATDQNRIEQNLLEDGIGTIIPDLFFIHTQASIFQQSTAGGQGAINSSFIPESQRTQVTTFSGAPYLRTNFGDFATVEARYTYALASFDNGQNNSGVVAPFNTGLSNSTEQDARVAVATGEYFGRLNGTLVLDATRVKSSGVLSNEDVNAAEFDGEYEIYDTFSIVAQGGYSETTFHSPFVSDIRGPIWGAGIKYQPNPDSEISLLYGERQGQEDFTGDLHYAIGANTFVFANYQQTIETTQQELLNLLQGSAIGPGFAGYTGGSIVGNLQTGQLYNGINELGLQNGIYRSENLTGGLSSTIGRNTFTITGFREEHSPIPAAKNPKAIISIPETPAQPGDTATGGTVTWNRALTPRMTGDVSFGYATETLTGSRTGNITAGIGYTFTDSFTGSAQYYFNRQTGGSTGPGFTEHALTLSLRKTF